MLRKVYSTSAPSSESGGVFDPALLVVALEVEERDREELGSSALPLSLRIKSAWNMETSRKQKM